MNFLLTMTLVEFQRWTQCKVIRELILSILEISKRNGGFLIPAVSFYFNFSLVGRLLCLCSSTQSPDLPLFVDHIYYVRQIEFLFFIRGAFFPQLISLNSGHSVTRTAQSASLRISSIPSP